VRLPDPCFSAVYPWFFTGCHGEGGWSTWGPVGTSRTQEGGSADEAGEELRLWADYYDAIERALELVRTGLRTPATLAQILAEDAKAAAAIKRIKEIRGIKD